MRRTLTNALALGCATLAMTGCEQRERPVPDIEFLAEAGTENLGLPFSAAVRVDDMLYLSGMIGNLPGTLELAPGGIAGQTRQTMENIKAAVEQFGSSMDRVVKCTVFLADMAEWQAMNEVYVSYFETPPARSALGASGLALDGRVEIECIAVVNADKA